jgi:hypothetical protein
VKAVLKFCAALAALFALYGLRAWFVLGGAFFGVVCLRGGYGLARETPDWPAAVFMLGAGLWLLRISYRWFAVRWHAEPPADAPAA